MSRNELIPFAPGEPFVLIYLLTSSGITAHGSSLTMLCRRLPRTHITHILQADFPDTLTITWLHKCETVMHFLDIWANESHAINTIQQNKNKTFYRAYCAGMCLVDCIATSTIFLQNIYQVQYFDKIYIIDLGDCHWLTPNHIVSIILTRWSWVTHICVGKLPTVASDRGCRWVCAKPLSERMLHYCWLDT